MSQSITAEELQNLQNLLRQKNYISMQYHISDLECQNTILTLLLKYQAEPGSSIDATTGVIYNNKDKNDE